MASSVIVKGKNARKPWTVRYWHEGKQRERSFTTQAQAKDFAAKFEYDAREHLFVDPRQGSVKFADAAETWIAGLTGAENSRQAYRQMLRRHVGPALGGRTLAQVANDRDGVSDFLKVTLPGAGLAPNHIKIAYIVIRATVNEAIKAGRITRSRINGITLPAVPHRASFHFPTHAELETLAQALPGAYRPVIWLMRGCGLRIGEALAVRYEGFSNGHLRISEQRLTDGSYGPLKHRRPGDYRDIPVPAYVRQRLSEGPGGYVFGPASHRSVLRWFTAGRKVAGIPKGFTPHSLRHVFASVALSHGVPITDVSHWLGHRSIQETFATYGHLVPSGWDRARDILDAEFRTWSQQ